LKHNKAVQEKLQEKQQFKFQMELKEKELLADSLKKVSVMYTKEAIHGELQELINDIPKKIESKFSKILKELKKDQDLQLLNEFETRFLGVYENFFIHLKNLAPDLTPSEQRVAALIRLNFSSKEIALITVAVWAPLTISAAALGKNLSFLRV
jgi:hypothetical protein